MNDGTNELAHKRDPSQLNHVQESPLAVVQTVQDKCWDVRINVLLGVGSYLDVLLK